MMQISFPYPKFDPVEVPEENLLGVFSPSIVQVEKTEEEIIEAGFSSPMGPLTLPEMLAGSEEVLVLVDDYTRATPVQKILPRLFEELNRAGIGPGQTHLLVALGTHRPMTDVEIRKKFGESIPNQYPIHNHQWGDPSQLSYLGETESGTPVLINRMAEEVDIIIGIGQIVPHRVSGFSGGGNIVQPGISGEETTGKTHWLSAQFKGSEILGKISNPVKDEIARVAQKAGLDWIINSIQNGSGRLVEVVAGDPVQAYRAGAHRSQQVYQAELPQEADIVITDSHPFDSELWLAAKGIYAAELAVKQGGIVILVSPCPEGVSTSHPEILEQGYQRYEEIDRKVREGAIKKLTVAAHLVHVGRVIRERAQGILVSSGISKEEAERLGFVYAQTPQEALEMAFSLLDRNAKVAILQRGGEILPVIKTT